MGLTSRRSGPVALEASRRCCDQVDDAGLHDGRVGEVAGCRGWHESRLVSHQPRQDQQCRQPGARLVAELGRYVPHSCAISAGGAAVARVIIPALPAQIPVTRRVDRRRSGTKPESGPQPAGYSHVSCGCLVSGHCYIPALAGPLLCPLPGRLVPAAYPPCPHWGRPVVPAARSSVRCMPTYPGSTSAGRGTRCRHRPPCGQQASGCRRSSRIWQLPVLPSTGPNAVGQL